MFFDRVNYKERGKQIVKANFWILVLASFVANMLGGQSSFNVSGGGSVGGSGSSYNFENSSDDSDSSIYDMETGKIKEEIIAAVTIYLTVFLVVFVVIFAVAAVFRIFVGSIMQVGKKKIFLENVNEPNTDFGLVFSGFTGGKYMQRVKTMFFYSLRIFLWSLLFLIPGIIAGYTYYLVPYIVADNPDIDTKRALELSKEMTRGHKFDIFVMELSFLGWQLLSGCCTCGILGFWVNPYMESSFAVMYTEMKNYAVSNGIATADEFGMNSIEVMDGNTY